MYAFCNVYTIMNSFTVTIESTVQQCIYLVLYHILLIMFAWSYWRTIFAEIKPIPETVSLAF